MKTYTVSMLELWLEARSQINQSNCKYFSGRSEKDIANIAELCWISVKAHR